MSPVATRWVVLTGPPCAGKSSVLEELARAGETVVREAARELWESERAGAERPRSSLEVQRELVRRKLEIEDGLAPERPIYLDRALPDSIAYWRHYGLDVREIEAIGTRYRYERVFFFAALPLNADTSRPEDTDAQARLAELLREVYTDLGYALIDVPRFSPDAATSIRERVRYVRRAAAATPSSPPRP